MSAEEWHYPLVCSVPAVSLYASLIPGDNVALLQWLLPGFDRLFTAHKEQPPMKGMWSGEKSANAQYKPAIDSVAAIDAKLISSAVQAVLGTGAALIFSATRDYGAICLTLLDGNDRHKVYAANAQELEQALRDLVDSLAPSHPPTQQKRSTR